MKVSIIETLEHHYNDLYTKWVQDLEETTDRLNISYYQHTQVKNDLFESIYRSLNQDNESFIKDFDDLYKKIVENKEALEYISTGYQSFRRVALFILIKEDLSKEEVLDIYDEVDRWFDPVFNKMISKCTDSWEETFNVQRKTLVELSAPVIQLFDHISVMPLVGHIDEERINRIKENLLEGVTNFHSSIVFLDITGVPVLDTFAAQGIIESTRAAGLLGAECILVGVRPEIAQTLINLGIDLKELKTFSSLNNGLMFAQNQMDNG
ncbi:STAS domain-containing protein [Bacillus sp. Marseille-Q1617]|uniref:STAS domain-containing protein n=1 Tax=Bacillus sp. Marseille-Q1617 TaxID=2736887 RepID=UPI00158AA723|nr:STAS domain-containing protein [Bacillus sp. Marseille-Q1617]